ncbi:hypothetical protein JUJ52_10405 [Virgibacillus sp. AGTR]|uniref:hypothetical protein n=1 Tax=Virgibacillus sp. AGTR TaxID=2812055 RepID=UPI001D1672EA|nr:hypothetical protein [Virgibacillus sp. AGTR]MCC2250376.1 hypothetical protein [Virgibacillus sp. AGTR]
MKYTLYLALATDDKRSVYAYTLANYEGEITSGTFITAGKRGFDDVYCGHVALQRALRKSAKEAGVIQLTVMLDHSLIDSIGFELANVNPSIYPSLCRTTQRIMRRFDKCELAAMGDEEDMQPYEVSVCDEALDALDDCRTVKGRWALLKDTILGSKNIIR